jgi:hypothetical protein
MVVNRLLLILALALSLAFGSASDLLAKGGSRGGSKGGHYSGGKSSSIKAVTIPLLTECATRNRLNPTINAKTIRT